MAHLAAVFKKPLQTSNIHVIRELSASEFGEFETLFVEFRTLRERQSLVHIFDRDFREIQSFVNSLESGKAIQAGRVLVDLNKRFMDYLASGYALREHLETALKRDFGRNSEHAIRFPQLLWFLEKTSFEYAFLQDFRNFVQHCAFPVGNVYLRRDLTGSWLTVTYSRLDLLRLYKGWKKCALETRPEMEIDLLDVVRAAHHVAIQKFSGVICLAYGKNLPRMDSCFSGFHKEAADINPSSVARIVLSRTGTPESGEVKLQDIPRNPYGELGLRHPDSSDA
jgi:hypothetical protein